MKYQEKKSWRLKLKKFFATKWSFVILALELSIIVTLFTGIFDNSVGSYHEYNQTHWYYVTRGIPLSSGLSITTKPVPFPLIRVPSGPIIEQGKVFPWTRIVDITVIIPTLFVYFLIFAFITWYIPISRRISWIAISLDLVLLYVLYTTYWLWTQWY